MTERGEDGQPLPDGGVVIRFAHKPKDYAGDGKPLPVSFEGSFLLSTDEKENPPSRLSVFQEVLTTPAQGWRLAGSRHTLLLRVSTRDIRGLRKTANNEAIDVVWHHIDSPLPGAEGHAGIVGWAVESKSRKFFRLKLAELSDAKEFSGG